ncbi:FtsX-like permease family protein [Oceanobacillus chungangensis]|uniref:Bacitracin ABC transporter permease n=1 Tax=Oceanobacillus chungangensis TaxID=1229152 RepID=A0A3D8PX88_9BACI|nr:ABC transporter permease [Oceanobacillus chungangensis]RDW19759.1 bacitracin ABC transporter permease [Oceanobacillus chungangensis]
MSINQLILRNLRKNIRNYYLYVFALIFSVALYFAFVTLQYDPSMDEVEGGIKGAAAIRVGSILLIAIVTVFLIYANNLFIKRRSKEIGLLQLVGLTKGKIFQILSIENMLLYFGSLLIGIFLGFSSSKLVMMILIKVLDVEETAVLRFSSEALLQTILVFAGIYAVILVMNAIFIKRQRILSLFNRASSREGKRRRVTIVEMVVGIMGLALISLGYYLSTKLFGGDFMMMEELLIVMVIILASVIIGTYLFYKGSISFIFNLIRKKNAGYLTVNKVLSVSSIMFRMKSNSLLLTVITTVSALAIGLLSLAYISYYSIEKNADSSIVKDFSIPDLAHAAQFTEALDEAQIEYIRTEMDLLNVNADISEIAGGIEDLNLKDEDLLAPMVVIPEDWVEDIDLDENESIFVNNNNALQAFLSLKETGKFTLSGKNNTIELNFIGLKDKNVLPMRLTNGGLPVAVVDDAVYQELAKDAEASIQGEFSVYVGININDKGEVKKADSIFQEQGISEWTGHESQIEYIKLQKQILGIGLFVVAFLGVAFLITSGCILYFKQMDESEEEKGSYTILRKLGFTKEDLLNGIKVKQTFNFGIPLLIGLCHSYFAVKSGWFLFGTELWTPMIIVMVLYALLYSIFGILSVLYSKRVISESL